MRRGPSNGAGRAQEYDTEAAFSAAVLLSIMALSTLLVKERLEQSLGDE
jgi:ABC-type sulfate transport system permease subunit